MFLYKIISVFTYIQIFYNYILNSIKKTFYSKKIFCLHNVFISNKYTLLDNTKLYCTNTNNINNTDFHFYKFIWSFYKNKYICFYRNNDDLFKFPPYSFEEMKKKPINKIISCLLIDDTKIQDVTNTVKMYAGPKHNFFSDINLKVFTHDIFQKSNKKLQIITIYKTVEFDLNEHTVLKI